ncbi:heterokaryon incompatibility protein-domain-containing protein [Xylariomycetidae sp. FL2044]|nr:heterokaryon incompatibility protein-domain-containing protein [Xylariomycetidae sp. FL2044]
MYLINTDTLHLEEFNGTLPLYAILSHTWGLEEVTFADFQNAPTTGWKTGWEKIKMCCNEARKAGYRYAWVDTCCINKASSAELSEAINSMFQWYREARVCYAYLEDYSPDCIPSRLQSSAGLSQSAQHELVLSELRRCKWFRRGWTLQELVASRNIIFFGSGWELIGTKEGLSSFLHTITRIPEEVLDDVKPLRSVSVATRMSWAARRETTRPEDIAYCLMGIFNVNMPMLYGEGTKAFIRLQEEILRQIHDDSLFAWRATEDSEETTPYRGLLAESPDEFADSEGFMPSFYHRNSPASVTNIGVGLTRPFHLLPSQGANIASIGLNYCTDEEGRQTVGVQLIRVGDNQYLRSRPSRLFKRPHGGMEDRAYIFRTLDSAPLDSLSGARGGAYLATLPEGVQIVKVHPWSTRRLQDLRMIPLKFCLASKVAFELKYSGSSERLLVILGVYSFANNFAVKIIDRQQVTAEFTRAELPLGNRYSDSHIRQSIFWKGSSMMVTGKRGKVNGADMFRIQISRMDSPSVEEIASLEGTPTVVAPIRITQPGRLFRWLVVNHTRFLRNFITLTPSMQWCLFLPPLACLLSWAGYHPILVFSLVGLAMNPLGVALAFLRDDLAQRLGPVFGGLLRATFSSGGLLILQAVAFFTGQYWLVVSASLGAATCDLLLILGLSVFFGGIRNMRAFDGTGLPQDFSYIIRDHYYMIQILGGTLFILFPELIYPLFHPGDEPLVLSRGASVILLDMSAMWAWFRFRTHSNFFTGLDLRDDWEEVSDSETDALMLGTELILLMFLALITAVSGCALLLVEAIKRIMIEDPRAGPFMGFIFVPIIFGAERAPKSIMTGIDNRVDLAVGATIASSIQILTFNLPLMVLVAWCIGVPVSITASKPETISVFLAITFTLFTIHRGSSTYLTGSIFVSLYVIASLHCYVNPA